MAREIPWVRVLAEGLVIVVSIVLGLAIDAWWTDIQAGREARGELQSVLTELEEARAELNRVAAIHGRLESATTALAERLSSAGTDTPMVVPDTLLSGLLIMTTSDVPSGLREAFIASGRLERVANPELRTALVSFGPHLYDLRDDEAHVRDLQSRDVRPYLQEFDIAQAQQIAGPWAAGELGPQTSARSSETEITVTTRLRNIVSMQTVWYDLLTGQDRDVLARLDLLSTLVAAELDWGASPPGRVLTRHCCCTGCQVG